MKCGPKSIMITTTKNIGLLASLASLAAAWAVQANDIEPGKEFYTAIRATSPIVLDGDLSEWTASALLADPRFSVPKGSAENGELVNFEEYNGGTWTGPDDHTSAVRVVYDDDNVYFGFIVTDEYHENSANSAWDGDSVQLMIANDARDTQVALYNYALGGVEEALGDIIVMHEAGPGGTDAVIKRNTDTKRTIYEIKLPTESLALNELKGGVQFGLGMAINDGDQDTPGQKGWGGLGAHSIVFGKTPQETARVTLATANDIEAGKEYHAAKPAEGQIVLDGELGDWSGVPVLSDPRFALPKGSGSREGGGDLTLFEEYNGGTWTGPDDHTSAVRIAYDPDNVYFAFVVTDDYHENSANSAWDGDSVQLMIANDKQDTQIALYNYALGGVEEALGDVIVMHEAGPGGTEAIVKRDTGSKRTTYEIRLPKESLELNELTSGVQFGLGMAINDGDQDTPGQKGWGGLGAHSIVFGKTPQETALVTLDGFAPPAGFCFLSAISSPMNATPDSFSFRANDFEGCVVDPDATVLLIDGQSVTLVASPKSQGATDFTHTFSEPFQSGSQHTFSIEIRDTNGAIAATDAGPWTAPNFTVFTPDLQVSQVDMTKPGFLFRIFQNEVYVHTSLAETELALSGQLLDASGNPVTDNYADPDVWGPAEGPGVVVGDAELVEFEIPTVINLNFDPDAGPVGNFQPDDQMPGIPGLNGSGDGADAEIITYVAFPAGRHTMGVNSDDGFRVESGPLDQPEQRQIMGQFDGGRGAANSTFRFDVVEEGIYPIRVIWQNGAGGANIELFTVLEDGTRVLLNDTANGGLATYRAAPSDFRITSIDWLAGDVALTWQAKAGRYYAVQRSTNLPAWETIVTEYPDGGAAAETVSYTDTEVPGDSPDGYYRVLQVPAPSLYFTDFEDGAEGWTTFVDQGETEWELGTPNVDGLTEAASGTEAWGTILAGDYGPNAVARLRSPVIEVSSEDSPRLSFNYFIEATDAEGGQLRFLDESGEVLAIADNFIGQSGPGWTNYSIRFPTAARGGMVIIEFVFLSDGDDTVGAGWYIDDFKID